MKNYNKILEAIHRGINLAIDDFDDQELIGQQTETIKNQNVTKEYLDLMQNVVDLGLPSGTLWFKYNLGCDYELLNSHPENTSWQAWVGKYYAWGELKPDKPEFKWDYYKYARGSYDKIIKYNGNPKYSHNGYCDKLTQLLPEDDAAYQNMHIGNFKFHMPTKKQFDELIYYTVHGEIKDYNGIKGLNGYRFVNNVKGNMVTLFIPYAGYCHNNEIVNSDEQGWYWSSTLYQTNNTSYSAYCLYFDSYRCCDVGSTGRVNGLTIRPVINL